MAADEQKVREAIRIVAEPDLGIDLVRAGVLKEVVATGDRVTVRLAWRTPLREVNDALRDKVRAAVEALPGVAAVTVEDSPRTAGRRPGPGKDRMPGVRNVVAVASGKGGVGKSTVAANLALALRQAGARVGVLDADVFGPSMPQMLGPAERRARAFRQTLPDGQERDRIEPAVHHGLSVISIGFFVEPDKAVIWRGPMVHKMIEQFCDDVEWGELDYLVCDLPPGTGDVQLSLVQLVPLGGAVIVTTPQEVALADVIRGIEMFHKTEVPVLGIVENMAFYRCPGCGHTDEIFARGGGRRMAEERRVPFLGEIPIDTRIRVGGDVGRPIVAAAPESEIAESYRRIARAVAGRLNAAAYAAPKRSPSLVTIR